MCGVVSDMPSTSSRINCGNWLSRLKYLITAVQGRCVKFGINPAESTFIPSATQYSPLVAVALQKVSGSLSASFAITFQHKQFSEINARWDNVFRRTFGYQRLEFVKEKCCVLAG